MEGVNEGEAGSTVTQAFATTFFSIKCSLGIQAKAQPGHRIIERLIGKGHDLRIYDKNVKMARLVGANRDFILNRIPHISRLMVDDVDAVLKHAQTVVIGNNDPEFRQVPARLREDQYLVDFIRVVPGKSQNGKYDGICW